MNVVFRVDASQWIGSGHVMRCLVLADALRLDGWDVHFTCLPQDGDLIAVIRQKGFPVRKLNTPAELNKPRFDGDYESWLHRSEEEDAKDFIEVVEAADWVVVDHYGIGSDWEKQVREKLLCYVLSIDDLNREHDSHLILDQNLWPDMTLRYRKCQSQKLLGPEYALLRSSFRELKHRKAERKNQVLAFFGGADPTQECQKLLEAASEMTSLPFNLKVVSGKLNAGHEGLLKYTNHPQIEVVQFLEEFEFELAQSKYAIGASGVSNWERFCLSVPATIVSVADNQRVLSNFLFQQGFVHYLGDGHDTVISSYRKELIRLQKTWRAMAPFNALEVDGFGAQRVVDAMGEYFK